MCEKSSSGQKTGPFYGMLTTGIEQCQRSGVFVNGTRAPVEVQTGGMRYSVPSGKAATVPVSQDVRLKIDAPGMVGWTVTSAVLPAQLVDAPAVADAPEAPQGGAVLVTQQPDQTGCMEFTLSTGDYTKLVFVMPDVGIPA